jgi:Protein of unknown function (DUF1190)
MGMIIVKRSTPNREICRAPARSEESEAVLRSVRRAVRRELISGMGRSVAIVVLATMVVAFVQPGDASARTRRHASRPAPAATAVYPDERSCAAKKALDEAQCRNAALNSHAEYEEKAPRFDTNAGCEQAFGRRGCSMRIGSAAGIGFIPSYKGFTLEPEKKGEETLVLPVIAGKSATVEFTARPVSRLDTDQDPGRGARAQAAWQGAHSPAIRSAGGALRYRDAPKDAMPLGSDDSEEAQPGPAATYPVSPAMLKSMQEEIRKYGNPSAPVVPAK